MRSRTEMEQARKRVIRLRWLHAAMVVGGGAVAMAMLAVAVGDLSLLVSGLVAEPVWVLPGAQALLSFAAAMVAIFLVAAPLFRTFPLERFVKMLERQLGKETYLLTCCELVESRTSVGEVGSPFLLEQIGQEALADLDGLSALGFPSATRLFRLMVGFCVLVSASLGAAMAFPEGVELAMTRLVMRPVDQGTARIDDNRLVHRESGRERKVPPLCGEVTVTVSPPEYVEGSAAQVAWGSTIKVLPGSTVEVACIAAVKGVVLEQRLGDALVVHPLETRDEGMSPRRGVAALVVEESAQLSIAGPSGQVYPDRLEILTVEDSPPKCVIIHPAPGLDVTPAGTITVLAEATDDTGIASVTLKYLVKGLDTVPSAIELARPRGQTRVVIQRTIPVSAFGADPGDETLVYIEAEDVNNVSGPSICTTAERSIIVTSPQTKQQSVVERLARQRDLAVDLAAGIVEGETWGDEATVSSYRSRLTQYAQELDELAQEMASLGAFKSEDTRRVAGLAASLERSASFDSPDWNVPHRVTRLIEAIGREMEQHAVILDGVVEKLAGEYVFLLSGRIQEELSRLLSMARQVPLDTVPTQALRRLVRKVHRTASQASRFKAEVEPVLPMLFSPTAGKRKEDWFIQLAELTESFFDSGEESGEPGWRRKLENLSEMVEKAARSVEGAYAQSMTRLSTAFRNAQAEITRRVRRALELNSSIRQELESLNLEVEAESRSYIRKRKTLEAVREAARLARKLARVARSFRPNLYLVVDRKQIVEFREKLARLRTQVAVLKIEEALSLAEQLEALTRAMEFSMKLMIRYGNEQVNSRKCRDELARVKEAQRIVESISSNLDALRPQRKKLLSLKSQRLEQLIAQLDALALELSQIRVKAVALQKMFPLFFGRITSQIDRLAENVGTLKTRLSELMLEEAHRLSLYMDETFHKLLDLMMNAQRNARSASAVVPGGAQPSLDLEGKEESLRMDRLKRYMELGTLLGKKEEWRKVVDTYYSLLLP